MAGKTESQAKQTKADDFYVAIARLSAKRSKDAICQNGACIVDQDDDRIISIGYNGMPLNCRDELMPWIGKNDACSHLKQLYVVHAEMNAIVSMTPQSVAKCTMYTTSCPCLECRKMICKSGVAKVFYLKEQSENLTNRQNDEPPGSKYVFLKKEDLPDENEIVFADDISTSESGPISWEQYFMGIAILAKDLKSKEVSPKEGACIVNEDKRILGIGYLKPSDETELQHVVVHAPVYAIVNKNPVSVRDCTIYVTYFPCNECAKIIVQSGIKAVVYLRRHSTEGKDQDPTTTGEHSTRDKASSYNPKSYEPASGCEKAYTEYIINDTDRITPQNIEDAVEKMFSLAGVRFVSYSHFNQSKILLTVPE